MSVNTLRSVPDICSLICVQNQLDFQCMKFRLTTKMAFWYPPLFPADFPLNVFIGHISINMFSVLHTNLWNFSGGKKPNGMLLKKLAVQNQLDFQCMKFRLTTKMAFWYPPLFPADFPHNVFIGHISINGGHDLAYLCVLQIEE